MMRRRILFICGVLLVGGCREADGPADPGAIDARIHLLSEPNGAAIMVDGRDTGLTTPDTIGLRRGDHVIELELDSTGMLYDYAALFRIERSDSVIDVRLPLGLRCLQLDGGCMAAARRQYQIGGMRVAVSGVGSLFYWQGSGDGITWPDASLDSYASSGMPLIAGLANNREIALGIYDHPMLVGLPAPRVSREGTRFRLEQHAWILPPNDPFVSPNTARAILVEEEIIADDAVDGVVVLRLTYRNVSNDELVHTFAPHIDETPVTYTDTWIGFAIDPDIGSSDDDWISYDLDHDMVFAYDANFSEGSFTASPTAPGMVGLRVLRAPAGTSVLLNSWPLGSDWEAGTQSELLGYGMLTGSDIYDPQHAHARIGYMPPGSGDMRMSVTAGPITLAAGETAEVIVAIAVAPPVAGSFTSGSTMSPGDPLDTMRPLYAVAAELRARLAAAEALIQQ